MPLSWARWRARVATSALVAVLCVVFVVQGRAGGPRTGFEVSVLAAGHVKAAVRDGEVWRWLTAAFLHGNALHLALNGYALWVLGTLVESVGGWATLPLVFLVSALGGSAASQALTETTSVGASGGLMGLLGYLLAFGWLLRRILAPGFLRSMLMNVLLMAVVGWVGAGQVDNAAHAGGFVTGGILGLLLVAPRRARVHAPPGRVLRGLGALSALGLSAGAALALQRILSAPAW